MNQVHPTGTPGGGGQARIGRAIRTRASSPVALMARRAVVLCGVSALGTLVGAGCIEIRTAGVRYQPGEQLIVYAPSCPDERTPLQHARLLDAKTRNVLWEWTGTATDLRVALDNNPEPGESGIGLAELEEHYGNRDLVVELEASRFHTLGFRLGEVPADRVLIGTDPPVLRPEHEALVRNGCDQPGWLPAAMFFGLGAATGGYIVFVGFEVRRQRKQHTRS